MLLYHIVPSVLLFKVAFSTLFSNEMMERLVKELVPISEELERNEFHLRKVWNRTNVTTFFGREMVTFHIKTSYLSPRRAARESSFASSFFFK